MHPRFHIVAIQVSGGKRGHYCGLTRDQVLADAEMLQRALRLRPPQLASGTSTTPRLSVPLRTSVMEPLSQIEQIRNLPNAIDSKSS